MSATEVIEEIKKLPSEEQQKVFIFVHEVESQFQKPQGSTFEASLKWAVDEHQDLLRRLAQ